MNEIEQLQEFCKEEKLYGFLCILIEPDGTVHEYTRLIDTEHMPQCIRTVNEDGKNSPLFQFYTDDAGYALLKALPYTETKPSEDGGLQQEANVNANVTEGLDGDADTSEELWMSEGGGNAPNNDNVKDGNNG